MLTSQPLTTIAPFALLTAALVGLWRTNTTSVGVAAGTSLLAAIALLIGTAGGLVDVRGLTAVLALATFCLAAVRAPYRPLRVAAHLMVVALCAAMFLHLLPGFENPRLVSGVVLSPGSVPYTKYLNFDKGLAGLLLLGLYVPGCTTTDQGWRSGGFLWRFGALGLVVLALSLATGYVQWDVKAPSWWPMWIWSMVFLTALPEEALFRGVAQQAVENWMSPRPSAAPVAMVAAGLLFGLAHAGGGPVYVFLAAVAGTGYGWIYSSTRSMAAAILAHAGLNAIHFFLFSYPALVVPG